MKTLLFLAQNQKFVYILNMNKKVGIERCGSYESEELYRALKRAVELAGDIDVAGKTVLLKPNIVFDSAPEKQVCTHPAFLEAAIRLVREMGASRILAGDSPGLQGPGFFARASGLGEAAKRNGAEWVDFTKEKIEMPCPDGKIMKKFTLTQFAREVDVIINLPKFKTHQLMYFTGAMKNSFGFVPSMGKSAFHVRFSNRESFASMIVDLNLTIKPAYALMDAVMGMEGPGPSAGTPRHIGLVMASSNPLAMDVAASVIIGYPPMGIPVNREALSRGYWLSSFDEIEYPGLSPKDVRIPDFIKVPMKKTTSQFLDFVLPRPLTRFMDSFAPGPEINLKTCVRCGDCSRICGAQAISLSHDGKEHRMLIDYRRCIRCFCCHEICPIKAIGIAKRPKNQNA
ncbi:MAG: DUF362 domain-containing protein [Treponema sp.]|nr:DUF362 domain-containing protein [Treponema sp.]